MLKFNKVTNLSESVIDQWIRLGVNVLLIGEKGVGKTERVIQGFKRNNLNYAYFSGSTVDPWCHLIGVPKIKPDANGVDRLDFVLPRNMDENIEIIFVDEYNRSHKQVRNAMLELQQFKRINGRVFPKLRAVWAAVNPDREDTDEIQYDVEKLDPAQMDRFHVIVELDNKPDTRYFNSKFGTHMGTILCDWFKDQSKESKEILSPRRLDYIGEYFKKGGDIAHLLPASSNAADLVKKLSVSEEDILMKNVFNSPTDEVMQKFFSDDKNYLKYKKKLQKPEYWSFFKHLKPEYVAEYVGESTDFRDYIIYRNLEGDTFYTNLVKDINGATKSKELAQVCKALEKESLDLAKYTMSQISGDALEFLAITDGSGVDDFSTDSIFTTSIGGKDKLGDMDIIKDRTQFDLSITQYRMALRKLKECYKSIKNPHLAVSFTLAALVSLQDTVLKTLPDFRKTFNSVLAFHKSRLNEDDLKVCRGVIHQNSSKMSSDAQYKQVIDMLKGGATGQNKIPNEAFKAHVGSLFEMIKISKENA